MAPNEASVADQQVAEAKQEQEKLGKLSAVEAVVNEYAKKFAKKHRVGEDNFTIVLVTKFKGIMGLKRGPVVQIMLLWPDAQPNINTLLDGAFRTINRNKMVDGLALESVIHIKRRMEDRKRMLREKIGNDEADIILDLIPKHRIKCTVTTTVEYEDMVTGEKISVTHTDKPEQFRGNDVSNWLRLSRIVRDNHPEEATRYVGDTQEQGGEEGQLCASVLDSISIPGSAEGDAAVRREGAGGQGSGQVAGRDAQSGVDAAGAHQIAS